MMDLKFAKAGTRVTIDDAAEYEKGVWHIIGPSYTRGWVDLHRWTTVRTYNEYGHPDGTEERHEYYSHADGYGYGYGYGINPKRLSHAYRPGDGHYAIDALMDYPTSETLEEVSA